MPWIWQVYAWANNAFYRLQNGLTRVLPILYHGKFFFLLGGVTRSFGTALFQISHAGARPQTLWVRAAGPLGCDTQT